MNKTELRHILQQKLADKIENLENLIDETRASNNETKSSMGDKYETSREMVQQEINNLQLQLNESLNAKNLLKSLNADPHQRIGFGSLVESDKGFFYIAVPPGEIIFNEKKIFVISPESPLAKAFSGKKAQDSVSVNGTVQIIKNIW